MLQKIITLPKQLANQIAAGEVVERPLSVVKELVENSIDAGADRIEVFLENGGKTLIEVRDNGSGIGKDDLKQAVEKYSTSKIKNLEDLYSVMTFGFRGEALASIASVSDFTLSSKTQGQVAGQSIHISLEWEKQVSERWMEEGTIIEVKDLFANTPARLNYLKTDRTEYVKIFECIQKMALAYPEISFILTHDDKETLHFTQWAKIEERIQEVYGTEFYENMRQVFHEFSGILVTWYISDPKISFGNKTRQNLYVNKRAVNSAMISKAIFDAYNRFISPKTYPGYVLFLDIDPTRIDANVHPRKLEVRFADEQSVFRSIYHGIKNELERTSLINHSTQDLLPPRLHSNFLPKGENVTPWVPQYHTSSGTKFKNYSPYTNTLPNPAQAGLDFNKEILWNTHSDEITYIQSWDIHDTPLGKIIGQVHNAYIVVETTDGIQILDQHAVAERVIFERISKTWYTPKVQQLLWGIGVHLSVSEWEVLENYSEVFREMWFEIDVLTQGNIMLHTIPDFMRKTNIEKIFMHILSDVSQVWSKSLDEVSNKIWAYTACRSAVKFWDPLSVFEMHALLRDASLDYSTTCPHGRPVVYDIGLDELQKKYER